MVVHIGHVEIPARDPHRAAAFYAQAFGWRAEPVEWPGGTYLALRTPRDLVGSPSPSGGASFGGLVDAETLGSDRPLVVLHVEDEPLDDCLERIEAAGGTVVKPPERIGDMGWFAHLHDTEGNLLGLWRGGD